MPKVYGKMENIFWKKSLRSQKGFTVIELLASIFGFSIVVILVSAIVLQVMGLQRRGFGAQKIQENTLYVMELIAREVRVSTIAPGQDGCVVNTLNITHPVNGVVSYTLNGTAVRRTAGGISTNISSNDVQFTTFGFCIFGSSATDNQQARIAIIATVRNTTTSPTNQLTFRLQTLVTTREITTEQVN